MDRTTAVIATPGLLVPGGSDPGMKGRSRLWIATSHSPSETGVFDAYGSSR